MEVENRCGEIKATLQKLTDVKVSPTARLVAVLATCGISDTAEVASLIGRSVRMVQVARNELRETHCADAKPIAPNATHFAKPIAESETHCAASRTHAPAQIELPSEVDLNTGEILSPPTPSANEARVGEEHAGHGVFVNCETIRHKAFSISLPGIRMGVLASGLSGDDVKTKCVAHALQWAAEIENGKRPDAVVPAKIQNFLSASIMGEVNRKAVAEVRMVKATGPAGAAPKPTLRAVIAQERAARAAEAAA
jgi:hypothetical protein